MHNIRPLSPALAKIAAEELNENSDEVQFYLDALKHWLTRQPHLKPRTQDQFLITFLRGSKFSLEKCKQKIDNYYTYRCLMPEVFRNRDPEDPRLCELLRSGVLLQLSQPISEDGPRVYMLRVGSVDFHKTTVGEFTKLIGMMSDLFLYEDDNTAVSGYVVIMDLAGITPFHIFHFDPIFVRKLIIYANKSQPTRMKGYHFINMLPMFEMFFSVTKSAVNEKLQKRVYFHGSDLNTLYEHVPKHCLPVEYGGECDTIQGIAEHWETKFRNHKEFFIEDETYGVDEKLREGKPTATDPLFGSDGTFRKLNVD